MNMNISMNISMGVDIGVDMGVAVVCKMLRRVDGCVTNRKYVKCVICSWKHTNIETSHTHHEYSLTHYITHTHPPSLSHITHTLPLSHTLHTHSLSLTSRQSERRSDCTSWAEGCVGGRLRTAFHTLSLN